MRELTICATGVFTGLLGTIMGLPLWLVVLTSAAVGFWASELFPDV